MQQTGCLKKRRKRNIAKVAGLSTVPYDETQDNFGSDFGTDTTTTGKTMFDRPLGDFNSSRKNSYAMTRSNDGGTRVNMSAVQVMKNQQRRRSSNRVTRNANFYPMPGSIAEEDYDDDLENDTQDEYYGTIDFGDDGNGHQPDADHTRPYFLNQKTMLRLRQLLILGASSGAFPWLWNKKTNQIDKWSPQMEKFWHFIWSVTTVQTTLLTGFQIYSFFARMTTGDKSYRDIFMMSFSFYWYMCAVVFNLNMYFFKDEIRQYINSLLKMNKKFVDRYLISADDYIDSGRILVNLSIPSNCCQVFISVSLFLRLPSAPWYLYSYIYTPENPWYWLIPGALQEFMVVGQVITSYMLISLIIVIHTNSTSFWLKEAHNHNDTGFTIDEIRDPNHAMRVYRSLQILCCCFNSCMSSLAIPMVKVHVWLGIIPTGFVLIRSMNQVFIDEFPGILTYPCSVLDCVTGGFCILAVAAEMYDLGVSFVDSWSRTRQKNFRRILMSCPTLKVKVGRFYAVTISTTITFFKSALDYIIDCIVTFP